ncbi:MAG: porin [gamma proteobacterium symbiont of Bathyaustriella thionipta]|nr:porin [gamma proteobacterium symbiont of Bathyaustriella thionipta]
MNKKILSVAMAAALGLPAASAMAIDGAKGSSVQLYGRFQVELTGVSSDVNNAEPTYVNDDAPGRWGVFATEKLGNGMTAFGRFEYGRKTDDGSTGVENRDAYVGLKGNWGLFLAGRHASPYKITGGVKADPFVGTQFEARRGGGMSGGAFGHTSFAPDIIAYASPNWNGFSFIGAYNPENSDEKGKLSGFYSVGAQYKSGPFWVWVARSDQIDVKVNDEDSNRNKIGAAFTFGNHSIRGQFEVANGYDNSGTAVGTDAGEGAAWRGGIIRPSAEEGKFYWLAYVGKFGNNSVLASFGDEDYSDLNEKDSGVDGEIKSYTIAGRHNFSKTFSVYGGWKRYEADSDLSVNGDDNTVDVLSIGMRKDWSI